MTKALRDFGTQRSYRVISSGNDPAHPDECFFVSSNRFRNTVHGPDKSVSQFVKIGTRTWMKLGSDPWEETDAQVDGVGCQLPTGLSVRSASAKAGGTAAAQQFAGRLTLVGQTLPYTARVDAKGQLLTLVVSLAGATDRFDVTYIPGLTIQPPK